MRLYAERETSCQLVAEVISRDEAKRLADNDATWPEGHDAVLAFDDGHREVLTPEGRWERRSCEKCGSDYKVTLVKAGQTLELCDKCKPDFVACDYPGGRETEPFRTRVTVTYATILRTRYDADARAEAVSRGLAVRTLGTLRAFVLVSIEGSALGARSWSLDQDGLWYDGRITGRETIE